MERNPFMGMENIMSRGLSPFFEVPNIFPQNHGFQENTHFVPGNGYMLGNYFVSTNKGTLPKGILVIFFSMETLVPP